MADKIARLWSNPEDVFFRNMEVKPRRQKGETCVATCLAMLTGEEPDALQKRVEKQLNTQDPVSWSDALGSHGMKLAYLPTDVRKLKFYIKELVEYDDLFLLGFYSTDRPNGQGTGKYPERSKAFWRAMSVSPGPTASRPWRK
jgi:hypothetical protein